MSGSPRAVPEGAVTTTEEAMMPTLKYRRSRAALVAGGVALLAAVSVAAAPAQAAVTSSFRAATNDPTAAPGTGRPGRGTTAGAATLEAVKARAAAEIARRQTALSARLTMLSTGSPHLTSGDRSALITLVKNDQAGLAALGTKIAADTDLETAKADRQKIFTDYRVFALAMPQVRLVRANDVLVTVAVPKLTDIQAKLQEALAKQGKTDQAAAKMADLQAQIAVIQTNSTGLSATLLALTPAQYNADHTVLSGPRQKLQSSRTALEKARADIVAVRAMLQS